MSYSCLEELQLDLDLHMLDKTIVLSKAGRKYNDGWFVVTDDGICHLFDKDGNLDDIKKIKHLEEKHIRKDITKIVIPDSVTSIGYSAFAWCSRLTSMMMPNSVKIIGTDAFAGCNGLTNIDISNGAMSIEDCAFYGCSGLTSVVIPNSVTSIKSSAFYGCSELINVIILNNVMSIGWSAFYKCNSLINLTFKYKTIEQVKKMNNYPWGIEDTSIIKVK